MKNVNTILLDRDDLQHENLEFDEISLETFKDFLEDKLFESLSESLVIFTDYNLKTKILNNPYGNITLSKSELVKVSFEDYEYKCSDGCCYDYGTIIRVNDTQLPSNNYQDTGNSIEQVLNYLGYKVEIDYL